MQQTQEKNRAPKGHKRKRPRKSEKSELVLPDLATTPKKIGNHLTKMIISWRCSGSWYSWFAWFAASPHRWGKLWLCTTLPSRQFMWLYRCCCRRCCTKMNLRGWRGAALNCNCLSSDAVHIKPTFLKQLKPIHLIALRQKDRVGSVPFKYTTKILLLLSVTCML